MDNLEQVMAQMEKSMAETKKSLEHTEALYLLLKQAVSTPVAEAEAEPVTDPQIELLSSPVQIAFNGLMNQVGQDPYYNQHSLIMVSRQPHYIQVEFKGTGNANWITLDVIEKGDTIHYKLERRMGNTDSYSALLNTDDELLALRYIQKEVKRGSLIPFKAKDSYRKLLPELKQVCFSGEVDATDMALYSDRIDTLNQAGELTDAQLDKLNRLMEELDLNWGEQS